MSATNFNTKNDTFRKLLGNGLTYEIPRFQRDYSWNEEHWEELWLDISSVSSGEETAHYMGYLVLQSNDDKSFEVIDGQQRITTLSLLILAVLKNLEELDSEGVDREENLRRAEQIRQTYIGYLDPVTLISRSKLTLNRNNDNYYQTYIVPLGHLPKRNIRSSEHSLRKGFDWFFRRIKSEITSKKKEQKSGVTLASFVESIADKLFFTVITVTDELNAFKVFETLNARGVKLSTTDLLKNYLFSVLHRTEKGDLEMDALDNRWENIVGRLGSESFPNFLRTHWNSRHSFVRQTELFKTIRKKITNREEVFELVRALEEDLDTYSTLVQPEASDWSLKLRKLVGELKMFGVKQPFPFLLAAFRNFSPEEFEKILAATVVFSFRYNVIGGQLPSDVERLYNKIAQAISTREIGASQDAIRRFSSLYPSDSTFKNSFSAKQFKTTQTRNKRITRYILCKIEKKQFQNDTDYDSDTVSLEHVLPQNPENGWEEISDESHAAMVDRLGNITLLTKSQNKALGNLSYEAKRTVYLESNFGITQKLGQENEIWNSERIATRQNWMATQASSIWRIDLLSDVLS